MKFLVADTACSHVDGGADSAVLRVAEPLFVPDPIESWKSVVALAVRIGRLGMCISRRNAESYFNAFSAVHLMSPAVPDGFPPYFHDRAMAPGTWVDKEDAGTEMSLSVSVSGSEGELLSAIRTFDLDSLDIPGMIAAISERLTFKTGDVIVLADTAIDLGHPVLDTHIEASLNQKLLLDLKIK